MKLFVWLGIKLIMNAKWISKMCRVFVVMLALISIMSQQKQDRVSIKCLQIYAKS